MAQGVSEDEAAAIAAAIARFEGETAMAVEEGPALSPWQRVALLEGISGKDAVEDTEGGARWLS
jgi:hypothetical protein